MSTRLVALALTVGLLARAAQAQQVAITFDQLPEGTTVTTQYPEATFSSDPGFMNTTQAYYNLGTSPPNYICTATENGSLTCNNSTFVDFARPVRDLTFYQGGDSMAGQVALVRVFENGGLSAIVPIIGDNQTLVPNLVDLTAFQGVTRIEIVDIIDLGGLAWDDFVFTVESATVIDFDDAPGQSPPFGGGVPVRLAALVDTEYLTAGVLFDSGGGGLARTAPSNPVSLPNVVASTEPGPVLSYALPSLASFWLGDCPAVVDYVQVTLTSSSSLSTLEAYDFQGNLLGSSSGGASAILRVDAPGAIHSTRVQQGPMGFDDFAFDGLQAIGALAVTTPRPGLAGVPNTLMVTGAEAQEPLWLCVRVEGPGPAAAPAIVPLVADSTGTASYVLQLPASLSGFAVHARVKAHSSGTSPWVSDVLSPSANSTPLQPVMPTLMGSPKATLPPN